MKKSLKIIVLSFLLSIMFIVNSYSNSDIHHDTLLQTLKQCSWEDSIRIINELAKTYLDTNPKQTIDYGKKALIIAERYNDEQTKASSYLTIGIGFEYLGQYDLALAYYKDANSITNELGLKEEQAEALSNIGIIYWNIKEYDSSLSYHKRALDYREQINNDELIAKSLHNIGGLQIAMGNLNAAQRTSERLLSIYDALGQKKDIADTYGYLGFIAQQLEKLSESLDYYLKELKLREEIDDKKNLHSFLTNIGRIYFQMGKYDNAEEYYQKSLEIHRENEDFIHIANSLNNLGNVYYESKNYPKTLEYYLEALAITDSRDYQENIPKQAKFSLDQQKAVLLNNIGLVYKHLENYEMALSYCQRSIDIKEELGDLKNIFYPLTSLAEINLKLKHYSDASIQLQRALRIAKESNNLQQMKGAYFLLYEISYAAGNFKEAVDYHLQYTELKDSIQTSQNNKLTAELQEKYESERKDLENKSLREANEMQQKYFIAISSLILIILIIIYNRYRNKQKANELLKEKNEQIKHQHKELEYMFAQLQIKEENLSEANATKDKFFSIIAHDLKNPLHAIVFSSEILRDNFKFMNGEDLVKLINNINDAGNHLSILLENLLEWSRAQSGKIKYEPATLDLKELVDENLVLHTHNIQKKELILNNNIAKSTYIYADYNMLNTVFRNLVSNAIKYTDLGGKIEINIKDSNKDFFEVSVEDNGIGISKDDIVKLFRIDVKHTTIGTSKEKGTGLGLIICKEFIESNGGKIQVESDLGKGSKFILTIPKTSGYQNAIDKEAQEQENTLHLN